MYELIKKISRPGLILLLIGIFLLKLSGGEIITSFKSPKSFEDVVNGDVAVGDRVQGRVPFLLDVFATEQTWTENRSTNSVTPKKTAHYYYMLPSGDGYIGLAVNSADSSDAKKLVDQTYGYISGGAMPSAKLVMDTRISKMKGELADMFKEELETYGFTDDEISRMTLMLAEPRSFTAVRVIFFLGAGMSLLGILLLLRRFRKFS